MRIIRPITVTDASLVSSNVPESPPAEWNSGTIYSLNAARAVTTGTVVKVYQSLQAANVGNPPATSPDWWIEVATTYTPYAAGTTYALGDMVVSTTTHHVYQSLQAANTGHALTDTAWWLDLGLTNRWKMFDQSNSSVSTRGDNIDVKVQVTGRADAVSLLNVVGASIRIILETDDDGIYYDETFDLVSSSGVDSWYEYFFEPIVRKGDFTVYDLPNYANPRVRVILNEPAGTASLGALVIGQSRELGSLVYGAKIGIQDFSRKEQDEFGNFTIVERSFAARATFKVVTDADRVDAIKALLAQYRATPVVWVGVDTFTSTWIYGWARDWSIELAFMEKAYINLELEGLT